ncbi:MAG: SPOR domain-containing protein [Clostridia bacterium]|nr:SPOR domain-containing protein [Clostridia bacterium]
MRRTIICLFMALAMYGVYMYTLPEKVSEEAAMASVEAQISAQLTLPAKRVYAVALGIYDSEEEARPDAAAYALRGAAGYIVETNDGWALLGAAYASEGEAASVCSQLRKDEDIDAQVILFSADEVRIGLTAARTQTDVITEALDMLEDIPGELMQLAAQIDAGQCGTDTAQSLMAVKHTECVKLRDRLSDALGNTADIFSRLVETELMELCDMIAIVGDEEGPRGLSFSSWLKQAALETELGIVNLMNTLSR